MTSHSKNQPNIKQAVPFFMVKNMEASVNFYVKGLGFSMTESWINNGKIKWCWLAIDSVALMLQEYDEKTNMIEQTEYGKDKKLKAAYTYSYEFDKKSNWTRQKKIQNGSVIEIREREISYH